jgi:2-phospho-L-lactate guanylyltransferase
MVTVVPFRARGKSRLPLPLRRELALAMLGDVVEAALDVGDVVVVTGDVDGADATRALGATVRPDPGGGQGAAVAAGLDELGRGPCLVANADLPCATADALRRLAGVGDALVAARDGTTNALALGEPSRFADLYGPASAARFAALGLEPVSIPELAVDVDTIEDLDRLERPLGRRTTLVLNQHKLLVPSAS